MLVEYRDRSSHRIDQGLEGDNLLSAVIKDGKKRLYKAKVITTMPTLCGPANNTDHCMQDNDKRDAETKAKVRMSFLLND